VKKAYAKEAANWLNGEMARMMNNDEISDMSQTRVKPAALATLVEKFRKRELNNNSAKQVFEVMYTKGTDPETVIKDLGLGMVSGADSLGPVVDEVIENNEKAVVDFLAGKEASLKFLMGQVMKATRGQADAAQATEMIREKLATRQ
jgi:aspartyl-tRNA(Asn)/glutamyl-tRNA(Gln) amidotransferase subunit B